MELLDDIREVRDPDERNGTSDDDLCADSERLHLFPPMEASLRVKACRGTLFRFPNPVRRRAPGRPQDLDKEQGKDKPFLSVVEC